MDYTIDYYQILEVGKLASKEELKAAYRRLAKLHHPDKNPGDTQAAERFRAVQQAYEVLSNDISRHVYDEYRSMHQQATRKSPEAKSNDLKKNTAPKANTREFTQTRKVQREKRVYVLGRIQVKYQGVPEAVESYMAGREQHYTVIPTETLVIIQSSGVYKDATPKDYEKAFSSAELFAAPISQPIRCQVEEEGEINYYNLVIHDLKIKDPHISNITHHEQDSFGELSGGCYGYIVHRYEEEVTETFTEYFGATGEVETKEEAGVYFNRQQYYSKDGSRYWGEWSVHQSATTKARANTTSKRRTKTWTPQRRAMDESWKDHAWIIYLFIALLIWPKTVLIVLLLFGVLWLAGYLFKSSGRLVHFIPVLAALLLVGLLGVGVFSLLHPVASNTYKKRDDYQPLDTHKNPLPGDDKDTLITHLVQWRDYDSNRYSMQLSVLQSAVNSSQAMHVSMAMTSANANGIGAVYAQLEQMDQGKLQYVYHAFDSIIHANHLNEMKAAKMMVSCIGNSGHADHKIMILIDHKTLW